MKKSIFLAAMVIFCAVGLLVSEAHGQLPPCVPGGACVYVGSLTTIQPSTLRVEGYGVSANNYLMGLMYHPYVETWLARNGQDLQHGWDYGYSSTSAAEVFLATSIYVPGSQYCTDSVHYIISRETGQATFARSTIDCKSIPLPPTPTPPPPTPTPTPCDPFVLPCQTPTPTPVPSPSVTISPVDVVERFGETTFKVTVVNNAGGTTTLRINTAAGTTGGATYEDGTTQLTINGNVTEQDVKIKGVAQSSQKDNMSIEATLNGNPAVVASRNFTVAVITELYFQKFDPDSSDVTTNPGNGQAGSNEGDRIFPDRNSPLDTTVDRSWVKVNAKVLPVGAGYKVFFGSFDLDDPSANVSPIDTNGVLGNDNNGRVNGSRSGDFTIPPSGYACTDHITGPPSDPVSKVACTTASDGTATAVFKTTMQPGDNFTVAATFSSDYRDAMVIDNFDGKQLHNALGLQIHISKLANLQETAGIRTRMLTIWRRLHIEVDSMGLGHDNYFRDTISGSYTLPRNRPETMNITTTGLEPNRFQNGRMELAWITNVLQVASNTANSVTVTNTTASPITLANNVNFQLSSSSNTRNVLGTIPVGQTINPSQTVTLAVTTQPLEVNLFGNGELFITPVIKSVRVNSNTANSVNVTNTGTLSIAVANGTNFRLYDDDDFDDLDGTNVDGDEAEDIPVPNTDMVQDSETTCIVGSDGKVSNLCNVLLPAYIVPKYDLTGSGDNILFSRNVTDADITNIYNAHFDNRGTEASSDFWTIYLLGGYQWILPTTNSPEDWDADPDLDAVAHTGNSFAFAKVDALNGIGVTMFTELNRSREQDNINVFNSVVNPTVAMWQNRPVGAKYTVAHELGHLFYGEHNLWPSGALDPGLMSESTFRTNGVFSNTTINAMRGGSFVDHMNTVRQITHP